jgi:cation transport regulator ChaC
MSSIGILAYGSLIEDPGVELDLLINGRVNGIETPFNVEFARASSSRDGAPTVVPVINCGAPVKAVILVLGEDIPVERAKDLLWRRETRNEQTEKYYSNPVNPGKNQVSVGELAGLGGIDLVLYTMVGVKIYSLTPEELARRAIRSAKEKAGETGKDGISYLISKKRQCIITPLMEQYEQEILRFTGAATLEEALKPLRENV